MKKFNFIVLLGLLVFQSCFVLDFINQKGRKKYDLASGSTVCSQGQTLGSDGYCQSETCQRTLVKGDTCSSSDDCCGYGLECKSGECVEEEEEICNSNLTAEKGTEENANKYKFTLSGGKSGIVCYQDAGSQGEPECLNSSACDQGTKLNIDEYSDFGNQGQQEITKKVVSCYNDDGEECQTDVKTLKVVSCYNDDGEECQTDVKTFNLDFNEASCSLSAGTQNYDFSFTFPCTKNVCKSREQQGSSNKCGCALNTDCLSGQTCDTNHYCVTDTGSDSEESGGDECQDGHTYGTPITSGCTPINFCASNVKQRDKNNCGCINDIQCGNKTCDRITHICEVGTPM